MTALFVRPLAESREIAELIVCTIAGFGTPGETFGGIHRNSSCLGRREYIQSRSSHSNATMLKPGRYAPSTFSSPFFTSPSSLELPSPPSATTASKSSAAAFPSPMLPFAAPSPGLASAVSFGGSSTATTGLRLGAGTGAGTGAGVASGAGVGLAVSSAGSGGGLDGWLFCFGGADAGLASGSAPGGGAALFAGAEALPLALGDDSGAAMICVCGWRARRAAFAPSPTAFMYISAGCR